MLIGSAEDLGDSEDKEIAQKNRQFRRFDILKHLVPRHKEHNIEVITTATHEPDRSKKIYTKAFDQLGIKNVGFIDIEDKLDARKKEYIERIEDATAVFFSGGNQFRVSTILGGTTVLEALTERYMNDPDFTIAGTSAGAMAIPGIILNDYHSSEALIAGEVRTCSGLGILQHCIVDTHFIKRGRFGRLAHAIMVNPGLLGVGLGEDTALLIKDGSEAECYGSGMVVVIDGKDIEQTNITEQREGYPVFVENLRVDLLVRGCRYSLADRRLYNPAIAEEEEEYQR